MAEHGGDVQPEPLGQRVTDVFDYIERFYNPRRRHSTIGYLSPMQFEQKAQSA